jgi:ankyrin repeat domain-containing protein 50
MVIDHVQDVLASSPNHEGFAFFYCNRNEDDRRKPLSILRSYVRQLSTVANSPRNMQAKLRSLYLEAKLKGSDLTFNMCREQLLESLNLYPKTTIVLDALDECEPDSRGQLIERIEFLLTHSKKPLMVFISSRPDGHIRDRYLSRPNIEIQATENQGDIEKFVNEEIIKHRRWQRISPSLREDIIKTLLDRSNGM